MTRLLIPFLALATVSFLGSSAYPQGRPAGAGKPSGVGSPSSGAGASSAHGSAPSAEGGNASSNAPASASSPSSVLSRNSSLSGALTNALGKSGITVTDLASTCSPFKTLGQCVAALHINHKFPGCALTDLSGAKSLGAGIHGCNPQADAKTEARNANKQANQEIKESGS
jgi:hypothetical protein